MINYYGKNPLFINCYRDNIIFCEKRENDRLYKFKCPKCPNYICFFCLKSFSSGDGDCCIKGRMISIYDYIPECCEVKGYVGYFPEYLLFIPFLSFLYIIGGILNSLFFRLIKPLTFKKDNESSDRYSDYYLEKSKIAYIILRTTRFLFAITIMIAFFPFVILNAFLNILLIISYPINSYPVECLFSMLYKLYNEDIEIVVIFFEKNKLNLINNFII